jgi:hypothetical protein
MPLILSGAIFCPVWPCRILIVAGVVLVVFGVIVVRKLISKQSPPN